MNHDPTPCHPPPAPAPPPQPYPAHAPGGTVRPGAAAGNHTDNAGSAGEAAGMRQNTARDMDEARIVLRKTGLPVIIRPAYSIGGAGTLRATSADEFEKNVPLVLDASPIREVLIEPNHTAGEEKG